MKYSPGFRSSVVRKTLDGSGRSLAEVARETGVSCATVLSWIEKYRLGKLGVDDARTSFRTLNRALRDASFRTTIAFRDKPLAGT